VGSCALPDSHLSPRCDAADVRRLIEWPLHKKRKPVRVQCDLISKVGNHAPFSDECAIQPSQSLLRKRASRSLIFGDFNWHSQTIRERHPRERKALMAAASLQMLPSIFAFQ
jgi:hypothetical protein